MKTVISLAAIIGLLGSAFAFHFWQDGRYTLAAEFQQYRQSQEKRHMLEDFVNTSTLIKTLEDKAKKGTITPEESMLLESLKVQQQDRMKQI